MNIQAWVNAGGPGVKSLLIVCCVCMGRMFDETCDCRGSELEFFVFA